MAAFVLVVVAMFNVSSALAADEYITVYGPVKTYASPSGKTQTVSFTTTTTTTIAGELLITNGSGSDLTAKDCSRLPVIERLLCVATNVINTARQDLERPSSVQITLNGQAVVQPTDLPKTVNSLKIPVTLKAANSLVLKIKGSIVSSITLEVRAKKSTTPSLPPVAVISPSVPMDVAPATITFSGLESYDPDGGSILSWHWSFPNGVTADGPIATSTFRNPGDYLVSLRVTDDEGASSEQNFTIRILSNQPPIVFVQMQNDPTNAYRKTFKTTGSYDPDGNIVRYQWVGQTISANTPDISSTLTGNGPELTFDFPSGIPFGQYQVYAIAYDNKGAAGVNSVAVIIRDNPTVIKAHYEADANDSMKFAFTSSGSTDIEGIKSFEWRDGDTPISSTADFTYKFSTEGLHAVQLRITDNSGAIATKNFNVYAFMAPGYSIHAGFEQEDPSDEFTADAVEDASPILISSIPKMVRFEPRLRRPEVGLTYEWTLNGIRIAKSDSVPITFAHNSASNITLTVRDGENIAAKITREVSIASTTCGDDENTVCIKVANAQTGIRIDSENLELEFPTTDAITDFKNVIIQSANGSISIDATAATTMAANKLIVPGNYLVTSLIGASGPFKISAEVEAGANVYAGEAEQVNFAASTYAISNLTENVELFVMDLDSGLPVFNNTASPNTPIVLPSTRIRVLATKINSSGIKVVAIGTLHGSIGQNDGINISFNESGVDFGTLRSTSAQIPNLLKTSQKMALAQATSSFGEYDGIVVATAAQSGQQAFQGLNGPYDSSSTPLPQGAPGDRIWSAAIHGADPLPWEASGDGVVPLGLDKPTEKTLECKAFELNWRMSARMKSGVTDSVDYLAAKKWLQDYETKKFVLERAITDDINIAFAQLNPDPEGWNGRRLEFCNDLINQYGYEIGNDRCLFEFATNPQAWGITGTEKLEAAKRYYADSVEYDQLATEAVTKKPEMEAVISNYNAQYLDSTTRTYFSGAPWLPFTHIDSHDYRIQIEFLLEDGTTQFAEKSFSSKGLKGDYSPLTDPNWNFNVPVNPFTETLTKSVRLPFVVPPKTKSVKFAIEQKNSGPEVKKLTQEKDGMNSVAASYSSAACRLADPGYYIRKVEYDPNLIDGVRLNLSFVRYLEDVFSTDTSILNALDPLPSALIPNRIDSLRAYVARSIFDRSSFVPVDADLTATAIPNSLWTAMGSERPASMSALNHPLRIDVGHPANRAPATIELKVALNGSSSTTSVLGYPIPNRSTMFHTSYKLDVPVDAIVDGARSSFIATGDLQTAGMDIQITPTVPAGDAYPTYPKRFTPKILFDARYRNFQSGSAGSRSLYSQKASPMVSARMAKVVQELDRIGITSSNPEHTNDFYLNDASLPFGKSFRAPEKKGGHKGHDDGTRLDIRTFEVRGTEYEKTNDAPSIFNVDSRFDDIAVLIRASRVANEINNAESAPLFREQECLTKSTWPNRCENTLTLEKCLFIETAPQAGSVCAKIHAALTDEDRDISRVRDANSRLTKWVTRNREALIALDQSLIHLGEVKFGIYHSNGNSPIAKESLGELIDIGFGSTGKIGSTANNDILDGWNWTALHYGKISVTRKSKTLLYPELYLLDEQGKILKALDESVRRRFTPELATGHFNHYHIYLEGP